MSQFNEIDMEAKLLEEAAEWYAKVQSDSADADVWLALSEWLDLDEKNLAAYDYVEAEMAALETIKAPIMQALATEEAVDSSSDNTVVQADFSKPRSSYGTSGTVTKIPVSPRKKLSWVIGMAVAASLAFALLPFNPFSDQMWGPQVSTAYETAYGQNREVSLADGSIIHLNTNTSVSVGMLDTERRVELAYGEAIFEVAPDKTRPFIVTVGDQQVKVVGTKFNILRHDQTMTVSVAEGIVDVSEVHGKASDTVMPGDSLERTQRLLAGDQLVHDEASDETILKVIDVDDVTSWQKGVLKYEDMPLSAIAKDMERYFGVSVVLTTDAAKLRFTGFLNMRDEKDVLFLLESILPVKVTKSGDEISFRIRYDRESDATSDKAS
ncbi:MAG: FecR domain-containing protein [Kordiimonas sp.]